MRFAIIGTRGIPARYGGFETFAEELSTRLVERGHRVTVYCRQRHHEGRFRGVELQYLPAIRHKYFETVAHTGLATLHVLGSGLGSRLGSLLGSRSGSRPASGIASEPASGPASSSASDPASGTASSPASGTASSPASGSASSPASGSASGRASGYDALLYCNAANAVFTWAPRVAGMPVALNVDGLERHRKKWNVLAKTWYRVSEWLATWMPNAVVTDAQSIARYYHDKYRRDSVMIPYGAETGAVTSADVLRELGLEKKRYFLYVSRMEPENNGLLVREAFERVSTDLKLALIGDAPYAAEYIARVRDTRDSRVVIPGAVYGQGYHELGSHCFAYIHATEVGGTHPALIEAMGRGALTLYLDNAENAEVAGGAGLPFTHENLSEVIGRVLSWSEEERECWRARALERVRSRYSWAAVTDAYERLLEGLAKG